MVKFVVFLDQRGLVALAIGTDVRQGTENEKAPNFRSGPKVMFPGTSGGAG